MVTFFPMNPKEIKKNPKKLEELLNHPRWCLQLKRDGVRGELHINPDGDGKNRIFGRKSGVKDKTKPLEMTHNLPTMANWKFPKPFHGNVYDVEIYHPDITASQLAGYVNPNRVDKPWEREPEIQFWCFDLPVIKGRLNQYLQWQRIQLYESLFRPFGKNNKHRLHTLWYVETFYDDKARRVQAWLDAGEEGGVLKNLDREYLFSFEVEGKRQADYWVKYKRGYEADFIIVGFEKAEKLYDGKDEMTCKYWEHESGSLVEFDLDNPKDVREWERGEFVPVTKYYFNGWIGSVYYGALIDVKDLEKHQKKYGIKFEQIPWSKDKSKVLIKIGKTSGFNEELRKDFTENPKKYLFQAVKITGMEQFPDTLAVRHPAIESLRWDKSPTECRIEFS